MVGALEDVAEHFAVDERVALVRASVVEGMERAVDLQDDDLPVAGVDHGSTGDEGRRRDAEPAPARGCLFHPA